MTYPMTRTPFQEQVDLVRALIGLSRGLDRHIETSVFPHVGERERDIISDLVDHLRDETVAHPDFCVYLDTAIVEIRRAISSGTHEARVPIPKERLLCGTEAYDVERKLTPEADALRAALPRIEEVYRAAVVVQDFAEAVRISLDLLDKE
ncbi:hypothetical protein SAMN05421688_3243 [Poseidonocella pacifica]|uniref:Uncharacterized protein n=1 Tax=Poseidonocella pacifica TaxID=871651 RepID=A0A1I0YPG1_9RHOB|nr:hypothetical protein [Poseidonocella pacifica]SFB14837.1 hypothetical protein SAMN05421688_3243 [Poseidonocella pacifica]